MAAYFFGETSMTKPIMAALQQIVAKKIMPLLQSMTNDRMVEPINKNGGRKIKRMNIMTPFCMANESLESKVNTLFLPKRFKSVSDNSFKWA